LGILLSLNIGKVGGIQIRLNYSWFLIFGLLTWSLAADYLPTQYPNMANTFYWTIGASASIMLFISILVHELAHSFTARREGMGIKSITLHFFGGVSEITEEADNPGKEFKTAVVGPLSSFLIGLLFFFLWFYAGFKSIGLRAILQYGSFANVGLAIFNSIPAFPMDGGRILRALIWKMNKDILKATRIATRISQVLSYIFMGFGVFGFFALGGLNGLWLIVIGFVINANATASLNQTVISQALGEVKVSEIMTRDVKVVDPKLTIQQVVDRYFQSYKHNGFPIMEDQTLLGMITTHDIRQIPEENWDEIKVEEIMKQVNELYTATPDENSADAWMKMAKRNVGRLPVIKDGTLVGIITRSDIAQAIRIRSTLIKEKGDIGLINKLEQKTF
jgi:Zn-dependent protease/CBS domain-containing protein